MQTHLTPVHSHLSPSRIIQPAPQRAIRFSGDELPAPPEDTLTTEPKATTIKKPAFWLRFLASVPLVNKLLPKISTYFKNAFEKVHQYWEQKSQSTAAYGGGGTAFYAPNNDPFSPTSVLPYYLAGEAFNHHHGGYDATLAPAHQGLHQWDTPGFGTDGYFNGIGNDLPGGFDGGLNGGIDAGY